MESKNNCGITQKNNQSLKDGTRASSDEPNDKTCQYCKYTFSRRDTLLDHIKRFKNRDCKASRNFKSKNDDDFVIQD